MKSRPDAGEEGISLPQTFALPGFRLKASAGAVFRARGRECRVSADGKGDTLRLAFRAEQTPDGFLCGGKKKKPGG